MRVPDRGTTDHPLESKSAQTNGDRGWSRGAGCRRHRGARAGAERWRLDRAHDDELDARDDASGVLEQHFPGDHASRVVDPAERDDRDDVAGRRADVLEARLPVDHPASAVADVDPDLAAGGLPAEHDGDDVAGLVPRDDVADLVSPCEVGVTPELGGRVHRLLRPVRRLDALHRVLVVRQLA